MIEDHDQEGVESSGMRVYGSGSITFEDGKHRVRVSVEGKRPTLGRFESEDEAKEVLAAYNASAKDDIVTGGLLLKDVGTIYWKRRRLRGMRSVKDSENLWKHYVEGDPIGNLPIDKIVPEDAQQWLDRMLERTVAYRRKPPKNPKAKQKKDPREGRLLSRSRILNALHAITAVMNNAIENSVILRNPFAHVKVPKRSKGNDVTKDKWHYIDLVAQKRLVELEYDEPYMRYLVLFALYSGLRQGELYNLEKKDCHLDAQRPYITVRFGSEDGPVKQERDRGETSIRDVYLFPLATAILRRWLDEMPKRMRNNKHDLVFPNHKGERRHVGEPSWWARVKVQAKLPKEFRWHDLRHTCGTSLMAGWWGRVWRLEEVQEYMAHANIETTQRYAKLPKEEFQKAVLATRGPGEIWPESGLVKSPKSLSHLGDSDPRPTVYETVALHKDSDMLAAFGPDSGQIRETDRKQVAQRLIIATATGHPEAEELAIELAKAMLRSEENMLARQTLADAVHGPTRALELAGKILGCSPMGLTLAKRAGT